MAASVSDRNLLFGILALQMDFISRDALIKGMNAWVLEKSKPLGQILADQGALIADLRDFVEAMIDKHLQVHSNDAQQSLAAVSSASSISEELRQIADPDLRASLAHVSKPRDESSNPAGEYADPYATRSASAGTPTSSGLRFRILRPHAHGALGEVFAAHDVELHREVALKQIQAKHADNPDSRARFLLEAEITGGLEHPGIVPVYGLGSYTDGRPFYAMRFIRGDSLLEAIQKYHKPRAEASTPADKNLQLHKLLRRLIDVCNALQYAHDRGVLHRDLKPGNIMLGKYGETLVVDWGLAKAGVKGQQVPGMRDQESKTQEQTLRPASGNGSAQTLAGSAIGTPAFMSPEQAAGRLDVLGPASDIYSLGATLYCILTGRPPLIGDVADVLKKAQEGDFPRPRQTDAGIPPPLEAVCLKAMALRPDDRYAAPQQLAEELEHWLADEPVYAWPEPWTVKVRRWTKRHRVTVSSAAACLVVTSVALVAGIVLVSQTNADLETANATIRKKDQETTNANTSLETANEKLKESSDELERTLARSLLRPIGHVGAGQLTHGEVEALWELVLLRQESVVYHFVREALRSPITTRQLTNRRILVAHVLTGLSAQKRLGIEHLLLQQLEAPELKDGQRADLALLAVALGDLTPQCARIVGRVHTEAIGKTNGSTEIPLLAHSLAAVSAWLSAEEAAVLLTQAMGATTDRLDREYLAEGLAAICSRLPVEKAAHLAREAARLLAQAKDGRKDPLMPRNMAKGLTAACAWLPADEAAMLLAQAMSKMGDSRDLHYLAEGLAAVCARLPADEAARCGRDSAALLIRKLGENSDPSSPTNLARGLAAVCPLLPEDESPRLAREAARLLTHTMDKATDPRALQYLAEGLGVVCGRLPADDARRFGRQAAALLTQAMGKTTDRYKTPSLARGLTAVCARLPADEAARLLTATMGETAYDIAVMALAEGLPEVCARLPAEEAIPLLTEEMAKTNGSLALLPLAESLAMACARVPVDEAAVLLVEAMRKTINYKETPTNRYALRQLAKGLAAVCARMPSDEAARSNRDATALLTPALARTQNPESLRALAESLAAVCAWLPADEAARSSRDAVAKLMQAMRKSPDPREMRLLAEGFALVCGRLPPDEAARSGREFASLMTYAMGKLPDNSPDRWNLERALAAVSAGLPADEAAALLMQAMDNTHDDLVFLQLAQAMAAVCARLPAHEAVAVFSRTTENATRVHGWSIFELQQAISSIVSRMPPIEAGGARSRRRNDCWHARRTGPSDIGLLATPGGRGAVA